MVGTKKKCSVDKTDASDLKNCALSKKLLIVMAPFHGQPFTYIRHTMVLGVGRDRVC